MGTTETGLRYPVGTDLVVDGDDAIRNLANDVTHASWVGVTASVSVPLSGTANVAITFPALWFTRSPIVVTSAGNSACWSVAPAATASGVTVTLRNISTSNAQNSTANVFAQLPPTAPLAGLAELSAFAIEGYVLYAITCNTEGCSMSGVPVEIYVPDDAPLSGATCGTCGQAAPFEEAEAE